MPAGTALEAELLTDMAGDNLVEILFAGYGTSVVGMCVSRSDSGQAIVSGYAADISFVLVRAVRRARLVGTATGLLPALD